MAEQQASVESTENTSGTTPPAVTTSDLPSHKIRIATDINSFREPDYVAPDSTQTPQTPSSDGGVFGYIRRVFAPVPTSSPMKASDVAEKLGREMSSSTEKGEITATKSTSALSSTMPRANSSQLQDTPTSQLKRSQTDVGVSPSPGINPQTPESVSEEATPVSVQPGSDDSKQTANLDTKETEHTRRETNTSIVSIPDDIPDVGASQEAPIVEDKSQTTDAVPIPTDLATDATNKTTEMPSSEQALDEKDAQFNFPSKKGKGVLTKDQEDVVGALKNTISQQESTIEDKKEELEQQDANLVITVPQGASNEAEETLSLTPIKTEKEEVALEMKNEVEDASKDLTVKGETPVEIKDQIKTTEEPTTVTPVAGTVPLGTAGSFKGKPESKPVPKRAQTMATGEARKTPSGGQSFFQRFFSSKRIPDVSNENQATKQETKELVSEDPQQQKEEQNQTPLTQDSPPIEQTPIKLELPPENTSLCHSEVADSTDPHSGARSPLALTEVFSEPSERPPLDGGSSLKTTDLEKSVSDPTEEDFEKIKELWKEQMQSKGLPINEEYQKKSTDFETPIEYLVDFHSFVQGNKHSVTVLETLSIRFGEDHTIVQEFVQAIKKDSTKDKETHEEENIKEQTMEAEEKEDEEKDEEKEDELQISTVSPVDKESEEDEPHHPTKDSTSIETTSTLDTAQTSTTQKTGESSTPRDSLEPKDEDQGEDSTEGEISRMEKLPESDGGLLSSIKDTPNEAPAAQTTTPKTSTLWSWCCFAPRADQ